MFKSHPESEMPQNDPSNISYLSLVWVLVLSVWGGTVRYIGKIQNGASERFTIVSWLYDSVTSGFIGFLTYALCQYSGIGGWLSAVLIGIASHEGTPALKWIYNKLGIREIEKQ